jgi:hypothetical protein
VAPPPPCDANFTSGKIQWNYSLHSNRGVFSFRRVPQIWRSQIGYISIAFSSRYHLFRLSPAATQTRGCGIPLYRPAGLWYPVGYPSHVLWDVLAPPDDPGDLRNIQKTRFGSGPRVRRRAYRRVSIFFGHIRAFDGPRIAFPPQESERLALGTRSSDPSVFLSFNDPTHASSRR